MVLVVIPKTICAACVSGYLLPSRAFRPIGAQERDLLRKDPLFQFRMKGPVGDHVHLTVQPFHQFQAKP